MPPRRRDYDPLSFVPSPEPLRQHLAETRALYRRLRILLRLSERLYRDRPATSPLQKECTPCR
jgi:hypothetical protein